MVFNDTVDLMICLRNMTGWLVNLWLGVMSRYLGQGSDIWWRPLIGQTYQPTRSLLILQERGWWDTSLFTCHNGSHLRTTGEFYRDFPNQHDTTACFAWRVWRLRMELGRWVCSSTKNGWKSMELFIWVREIWGFPEIGVPLDHPFNGMLPYKPSILGIPHLWTPPYGQWWAPSLFPFTERVFLWALS